VLSRLSFAFDDDSKIYPCVTHKRNKTQLLLRLETGKRFRPINEFKVPSQFAVDISSLVIARPSKDLTKRGEDDGILEWHLKLLIINTLRRSELLTIVVKTPFFIFKCVSSVHYCKIEADSIVEKNYKVASCMLPGCFLLYQQTTRLEILKVSHKFEYIYWAFPLSSLERIIKTFKAAGTIVIHFNISSRQIPFIHKTAKNRRMLHE
jgi:hypothetical protein